jgi:hypothetical protein
MLATDALEPPHGVILRHDRPDSACVVDEDDWPAIVSLFGGDGGASLVAPSWLLTAAHTAANLSLGHELTIGGRTCAVAEVRVAPARVETEPFDLALVRLATPVREVTPLLLHHLDNERGKSLLLFGRGDFGNGRDGVLGVDHKLRCVSNRVDSCNERWLRMRFDVPPGCTRLEGVGGEGDSGGPALLRTRAGLRIAGVSSWQDHDGALGTYGCVEHYARVSTSLPWITSVIGA